MQAYIARQPIFNSKQQVEGYELLYRDGISGNAARVTDGGRATSRLLSDAITLFGLPQLTNFRPAYINFTKDLILNDFVLLAKPQEIVVELTENIRVTNILLQKLQFLKDEGYVLALDNYSGEPAFDRLLPYADVLKVDFQSVTPRRQQEIGARHRGSSIALLAEKIETREEFCRAVNMGYELFQGYFFERPSLLSKRLPSLAASSCGRILRELREDKINFDACAEIIHSDAVLTYRIMQRIQTLQYYRGNVITALKAALVMLGAKEFRRWTLLLLARENNVTRSDELVRLAYLRGIFTERLLRQSRWAKRSEDGFLLGMFSLMDQILGMSMEELLREVELPNQIAALLLGKTENAYSLFLQYVLLYESGDVSGGLPELPLRLEGQEIATLYMDCVRETDQTFSEMGEMTTPWKTEEDEF